MKKVDGHARFQLGPVERFAGTNARIKKPTEVAYFSYDTDHKLLPFDDSSLRYYYPAFPETPPHLPPNEPIDLSKGFATFRGRDDSPDEHLDGLLETLIEAERRTGQKTEVDIITWRGMMTKILTAPFERDSGFEMNATLFQGTIFIEECHEHKLQVKAAQSALPQERNRFGPPQDLAMFWGYKFETLSLLSAPWAECTREQIEGRENEIVDNYAQYCSIVKTSMGSTSMIIAGEVDGVLNYKPEDPNESARWIELKTSRFPDTPKNREIHDKKLLRIWAQSFLLAVPTIYMGYRSANGHLLRVEELQTQRIPSSVNHSGTYTYKWDGNICINATAAFLDFLKATIVGQGVWRIRKAPRNSDHIEIFKIEETGTGNILSGGFLKWRTVNMVSSPHSRSPAPAPAPE